MTFVDYWHETVSRSTEISSYNLKNNFTYCVATMGATLSADMSTLFDVGGIAGAIIAGVVSDKTDMPAITCSFMLVLTAPMVSRFQNFNEHFKFFWCFQLVIYQKLSTISIGLNMLLLVIVGLLVNGPYALITTAVAAELGTHHSLEGNSKALATVAAIIDGTGSIGTYYTLKSSRNSIITPIAFQVLPWGPSWPGSCPGTVGRVSSWC